jgi:hypothetical protein
MVAEEVVDSERSFCTHLPPRNKKIKINIE